MLTESQAELLAFIKRYMVVSDGVSPSFDEMREAMGLASMSGVHRLVTALEERGFLRRLPNRARALEVIDREQRRPLDDYTSAELLAELARRSEERRAA